MNLFDNTIVTAKQLSVFMDCHEKTARKYYAQILEHVGKPSYGLLVLEDLANYYQVNIDDLKNYTINN